MKKIYKQLLLVTILAITLNSCKKDLEQTVISANPKMESYTSSASTIVLSETNKKTNVVTFTFTEPDYGVKLAATHVLQFDLPADTSGTVAWGKAINVLLPVSTFEKGFLGSELNAIAATQLKMPTGVASKLVVRLKSDIINQSTSTSSKTIPSVLSVITLTITPFEDIVVYPALLVQGGNSWKTPDTRSDGYLLTSLKFDSKYEGYLNLTNADGWGGDAFKLASTTNAKVYGYGSDANTMSLTGGNLWLTPSPAYMKVNADVADLTIKYTPVKFSISGDDNGWGFTPMTFNATTHEWVASNVSLTAGKTFVFTSNGSYDISYKVDAKGALVFAGPPSWAGNNIPVAKTGIYTVTLNLSKGNGNYVYSVK